MAASMEGKAGNSANKSAKSKMSQEQIVAGFQDRRQQQRAIAGKISELEMERKEHDLVIDTLKEVADDRKCFRMVGGVLVERTVKEVLPALVNNYEQLGKVLDTLSTQLETKGRELNEYRETHNIRVRGKDDALAKDESKQASTQGVLVAPGSS